MTIQEYGSTSANIILIQMVDDHDLAGIENEVSYIREHTAKDFRLLAVKVRDWNTDCLPGTRLPYSATGDLVRERQKLWKK